MYPIHAQPLTEILFLSCSAIQYPSGRHCIENNLICSGNPSTHHDSVVVSRTTQNIVLGSSAKSGRFVTSVLLYGVLHQQTNLTKHRVRIAVRDATTGEEILVLDERSFGSSARRVLKSTTVYKQMPNLPLYFVKLALRGGCGKTEGNCFTLGATRKGRPLLVTETIFVTNAPNVRLSMVPSRYMQTYNNKGNRNGKGAVGLTAKKEEGFLVGHLKKEAEEAMGNGLPGEIVVDL